MLRDYQVRASLCAVCVNVIACIPLILYVLSLKLLAGMKVISIRGKKPLTIILIKNDRNDD